MFLSENMPYGYTRFYTKIESLLCVRAGFILSGAHRTNRRCLCSWSYQHPWSAITGHWRAPHVWLYQLLCSFLFLYEEGRAFGSIVMAEMRPVVLALRSFLYRWYPYVRVNRACYDRATSQSD